MSIYRSDRGTPSAVGDVTEFAIIAPARTPAAPAGAPDPGAVACGHLRKSIPMDTLLPETVRWAARLPDEVRPYALMKTYPRVANQVAAAARDRQALFACVAELLINRRGKRRGFPAAISTELFRLRDYYEHPAAFGPTATGDR